MSQTKIYSNRCWVNNCLQPATVIIHDGVIQSVDLSKHLDAEDYGDLVMMPGVIDAHVHINQPGRTEWEGFETATKAAAAGGITMLADMPLNSSPVTTSVSALHDKIKASNGLLSVNVGFYGGIVPGNKDQIIPLAEAGVIGFKCFLVHSGIDEFPNVSEKDLEQALPLIAKTGLPLLVHCEIEGNVPLIQDVTSYKSYLASRPGSWEKDAVEMMIQLCRKYKCRVHIVHVSYAGTLDIIKMAKAEGLPITAETCPHYIFFNSEEIPDANTLYKCAPPIRDKKNNNLLKQALKEGTLDFIASDHSPAPPDIKEINTGNLQKAWGGIAGLQFLLSSSWSALKEELSLEQFIPLLTSHPASFLSLKNQGTIKPGYAANLVLWNPEKKFLIDSSKVYHRYPISPYVGPYLFGEVAVTFLNGNKVFDNEVFSLGGGKAL